MERNYIFISILWNFQYEDTNTDKYIIGIEYYDELIYLIILLQIVTFIGIFTYDMYMMNDYLNMYDCVFDP